ncbi:aromatic prenyltransferase [Aspergillus leporis]|uniref:Aromatic prenyltransferase n=1 Tax=Aspergillus leporis TaxID=41062 RepID=A0A5N5WRL6_9EURO|nr:aromatic prenyltransferase [Aspergillus leporis]
MFWWETTGSTLGMMMQKAGYDIHRQYHYLLFYYHHIAPLLGKRPTPDGKPSHWKSFMTDDYTPIELSWSWTEDGSAPTVRFSIEPICPDAGSSQNPVNQNAMAMTIAKMESILSSVELDLGWYQVLSEALTVQGNALPQYVEHTGDHRSQNFVAFDLNEGGVLPKAYFLPGLKAIETGQSKWSLVHQALSRLNNTPAMSRAISHLARLIESRPEDRRLEVEIVGIDCIKPEKSRVKIYIRSRLTTFDDVQSILTLGGTFNDVGTQQGIRDLRSLWASLFGLDPDFPFSVPLSTAQHRTSGILYYFELSQKSELPMPKVYLPVRHYGQDDLRIGIELERFLSKRHRYFVQGSYVDALRDTIKHRSLDSGRGLHTYISCMVKGGSLSVTSYLNPEIYHPARWT